MAFFKFRKKDSAAEPGGQPNGPVQSVEELRRRAKYRLVGAAVLVLIGVIGLPLLLDRQPRPIPVNTPIEIPDRDKVLPLVIPTVKPAPPTTAPASESAPAKAAAVVTEPAPAPEPSKNPPPAAKPAAAAASQATSVAPPAKPDTSNRAQDILEGRNAPAKPPTVSADASKAPAAKDVEQRFVVQVGAFADNARAHEVRVKLEKAGLKTYAQVAETKDGKRIRVRVGPFATKADADKVATKVKKLDLPAAVLTL